MTLSYASLGCYHEPSLIGTYRKRQCRAPLRYLILHQAGLHELGGFVVCWRILFDQAVSFKLRALLTVADFHRISMISSSGSSDPSWGSGVSTVVRICTILVPNLVKPVHPYSRKDALFCLRHAWRPRSISKRGPAGVGMRAWDNGLDEGHSANAILDAGVVERDRIGGGSQFQNTPPR